VKKMQEYERMRAVGDFDAMPKKEALMVSRELEKLERNLGGIRDMAKLPDAIFVIDTKKEHISVTEANKLKIPVVAVVDTNCDPDLIDYVIPGNDDAIRSGTLMCRIISEAVKEGRYIGERRNPSKMTAPPPTPEQEAERARQQAGARAEAARQAAEREARIAAGARTAPEAGSADAAPAPGSEEETELAVPTQSAPVVAHERAGDPLPEPEVEPSDVEEPTKGAIPPGADDDELRAEFPGAMPGSARAPEPPHLEEQAATGEGEPSGSGVGAHHATESPEEER
jgi:small subunit ribosomal protein S2